MGESSLRPGANVGDSLRLRRLWRGLPPPRAIVTSPPYLDMHDYGNGSRIGVRGQSTGDYLDLLEGLFGDCHAISSDDATFWLVAGSVRREGRIVRLPNLLADRAERVGWTLREAITWDKRKALPWTHHGELRDITEQVLLFSKSAGYRFDADAIRTPVPNSIWWRRYPERYSPEGWLPTNLWSMAIPTQGSWSGDRTHFCPFPDELTHRMLALTTEPGDVVLDPLAGSGAVPAMAEAMGRIGYGIDLKPEYAALYGQALRSARSFLSHLAGDEPLRDGFRRAVVGLRLLKFARLLGQRAVGAGADLRWVRVRRSRRRPRDGCAVTAADFELALADGADAARALAAARSAAAVPPLSKFGVDARIAARPEAEAARTGWWYPDGHFWKTPSRKRPPSGGPHVLSSVRPDPDRVDDIPYSLPRSRRGG